jgi:hypothetical protein
MTFGAAGSLATRGCGSQHCTTHTGGLTDGGGGAEIGGEKRRRGRTGVVICTGKMMCHRIPVLLSHWESHTAGAGLGEHLGQASVSRVTAHLLVLLCSDCTTGWWRKTDIFPEVEGHVR